MHGIIFNDIIFDRLVLPISTKSRKPHFTSQIHWECQTVMTVVGASLICLYLLQEAAFPPAAERRVMMTMLMMMTSLLMMRKRSRTQIPAMWAVCERCQCRVETDRAHIWICELGMFTRDPADMTAWRLLSETTQWRVGLHDGHHLLDLILQLHIYLPTYLPYYRYFCHYLHCRHQQHHHALCRCRSVIHGRGNASASITVTVLHLITKK